ncbi:restriction endonuclease subunit S [Leuconostoc gasicomitatum]|uniref:restriction endonuclease subunit S n=1 Tax=Leuconostoc gasicomitatum TaxID=115778 RepID=UPI001CC6AF7D|nr:restriction endonuclease subunit S [Leuconostoc gasicomitatum]MBZ5969028.1 restriction endonuclease subunit S [Leuconostoc gasicomitatum]
MSKTPKLRFPGFTDDWEQRKLGDLYKKNLERNKDQFKADKTISIASMRFKPEGNGASESSLSTYKVLREGDIAFEGHKSKQFSFGRFVVNDIGNGIMSPRFTTLRPSQQIPIKFWKQYINYEPIMKYPIVNSTKLGTMMNELVMNDFLKQTILVPSIAEQEIIGSFFKQLDNLITLHQRKLSDVKKLKAGMLQKMFPKNGETIPEVRFPEFTNAWEQRKLGDLADFFDEKRIPIDSGLRTIGKYPYYGATGVIDYVHNYIFEGEYVLLAEDGANITMRNSPLTYLTQGKFWLNNHAHIMKMKNGDNGFLIQLLEKQDYIKYNTGTAQPKLNAQVVKKMVLPFTSIDEQEKIGALFEQLDDLITLHQRKLEHLQQQKKALLQQMFI